MSKNYFVGRYVDDMRDLYALSLVSGLNGVAMGAPGWGKTDIALSMLQEALPDQYTMVRVEPSTLPQEVKGGTDIPHYLATGEYRIKQDGTAFDPKWKAIVIDEIGRANRVLVGTLMFVMDRKDICRPAPVIATSNFMPTSPEAEAMLDRIALWHWVKVNGLDVSDMARAQMAGTGGLLSVVGKIPTDQEIDFARNAKPGPQAIDAVAGVLSSLASEAMQEGFNPHPRRVWQWQRALFAYSAYLTGTDNFSSVPADAVKALRFVWPAKTQADHERWSSLILSMSDPVGGSLDAEMVKVYTTLSTFAGLNATERTSKIGEAFAVMSSAQQTFDALYKTHKDQRLKEASDKVTQWFANASQGKAIER